MKNLILTIFLLSLILADAILSDQVSIYTEKIYRINDVTQRGQVWQGRRMMNGQEVTFVLDNTQRKIAVVR